MADATDTASVDAEADLVRRAQAGDEAAFGELVKAHYERVFRHVVGVTRNEHDARDVCQEIWVGVWGSLKDYRGESKFSTWLYTLASRRAIDHVRKRRRWFDRFLPFLSKDDSEGAAQVEPPSTEPDPSAQLERGERDARFEQALAALPPKLRAVLAMRELDGLAYDEIAQILKIRPGTVMSRLFNARRQLAQKLRELPCD